jgi:hypothetical protein
MVINHPHINNQKPTIFNAISPVLKPITPPLITTITPHPNLIPTSIIMGLIKIYSLTNPIIHPISLTPKMLIKK